METSQTCIKNNSSIDNPSSLCDISPCVNNNEFHSPQNKISSSGIKKIAEGVNGEIFQTTNFFSRIYNACEIKSINKAHSEISSAFREYFCYLRKNKETFSNISNDMTSFKSRYPDPYSRSVLYFTISAPSFRSFFCC